MWDQLPGHSVADTLLFLPCTLQCVCLICQRHPSPAWGFVYVSQNVAYPTFTTVMPDLVMFRWAGFLTSSKTDRVCGTAVQCVVSPDTVILTGTNNHELTD